MPSRYNQYNISTFASSILGIQQAQVELNTPNVSPSLDNSLDLTPNIPAKKAPDALAEHVNTSTQDVGATIYILEENSEVKYVTNEFFLSSFQISLKERVQVLEAFNSSHVTFFDEAVRVYNIAGAAIDHESQREEATYEYFQQSSMIDMYDSVLRGSKLLERNAVGALKIKNHLIYGYPINLNVNYTATADKLAQFSMQWVVTNHELSAVNTVSNDQLKQLYSPSSTNPAYPYIKTITDLVKNIDRILLLKKWDDKNLVTLLGVNSVTTLTYGFLIGLPSTPVDYPGTLKTYLKKAVEEFYSAYLALLKTDSTNNTVTYLSPLMKRWVGSQDGDKITSAIDRMLDNGGEEFFSIFLEFCQNLTIFKNELLIFKSRLLK